VLNYVSPDFVHVLLNGRIVNSGGRELALQLESKGYDWIREDVRDAERQSGAAAGR
jgi:Fe-S cluster assembly ATP-binding protein